MADNFRPHRTNASRIPEKKWESYKSVLLDKCQTMTFAELERYMKREHNFAANRRQLGHRIRVTWGFKKYKRGNSPETSLLEAQALCGGGSRCGTLAESCWMSLPPWRSLQLRWAAPDLAAVQFSYSEANWADVKTRDLWLADMLVGLRDSRHAFDIHEARWKDAPSSKHTLACIGTAQYTIQLTKAREMARHDAEPTLGHARSQSWVPTFMDLLNAHTYDWGSDMEKGLGQISRIFKGILEETTVHDGVQFNLVELTRRNINLDIPAYTLFRSALEWYNWANPDTPLDAPHLLNQFIVQHLSAIRGLKQIQAALDLDIDCLPSCIRWCSAVLGGNPQVPPEVRGADGDISMETFTVLCVLWRPLSGSNLLSNRVVTRSRATPSPDWATTTEKQLGIRPPQLLCTVVCMIMAAAMQQQNMHAGQSLLGRALAGANILDALDSEDLLRLFLNQTCADIWRLKIQTDADRGFPIWRYKVDTQKMEPFRRFVATSLGIHDLPILEQGVIFDELALAGPEFPEDGYY